MRWRLLLLVAATTSLVVIAFLAPLAVVVRQLSVDRALTAATEEAHDVAVLVAVVPDRARTEQLVRLANDRSTRRTSVVLPAGPVVGPPVPRHELAKARTGQAFTGRVPGGREVFVPVATSTGTTVVATFVPDAQLSQGVLTAIVLVSVLGLLLLLVALVVADRLARWTLRPVADVAATAHELASGDLSARAETTGPGEIVEVAESLNDLGRRIAELLAREREAVADLSHRLRTPVTALRLEAEALRDPVEADRITERVTTLERTVSEVIRQSSRPAVAEPGARCDATTVVRDRVAFWAVLAEDQGRRLELWLPDGGLAVGLSAEELAAALDALLENVFAHTPDGTPFTVRLRPEAGGGARLDVADGGPGFGDRNPTRRGASGGGSTGLGLDIARRAAELSGGRLEATRGRPGGSLVTLVLGRARPASTT